MPLWFGINRGAMGLGLGTLALLLCNIPARAAVPSAIAAEQREPVELAFASTKSYQDPFNEVDVDVIFVSESSHEWRVPAYWAGGNEWKARFSPPEPGDYTFHTESTDKTNADLNGKQGRLIVTPYRGSNSLLLHGALQVSANKRYFQYADGTPFFWLADTWWEGLPQDLERRL